MQMVCLGGGVSSNSRLSEGSKMKNIRLCLPGFVLPCRRFALIPIVLVLFAACRAFAVPELKAALLSIEEVSSNKLAALKKEGYTGAGIVLSESNSPALSSAANRISQSALDLYYWIEIGRNPA